MEEVLEYGNLAVKLRRKSKEGYTHEWTVYVRPPPGREFIFVDKVVFNLHETCQRPIDGVQAFPVMCACCLEMDCWRVVDLADPFCGLQCGLAARMRASSRGGENFLWS